MKNETNTVMDAFRDAIADMSLREVAKATGINHATIRELQIGAVETPQPKTLRKIQAFLDAVERRAAEDNARKLDQALSVETADAAIEALTGVLARVEELLQVWRARRDLALRADHPLPDALTLARRAAVKEDGKLFEAVTARRQMQGLKLRPLQGDGKRK